MCDYRIDTSSNGNLVPVNMFKVLFPNTTTAVLNKCIDQKNYTFATTHTFHKKGICKVTITHEGTGF